MNGSSKPIQERSSPKQIQEQLRQEYERARREARELELLIRQSTAEVERLSQHNTQVTNRVRQMEATLDTLPREHIRETYTQALDAQLRFLMMRGQLEQLQAKHQMLERYIEMLQATLDTFTATPSEPQSGGEASSEAVSGNSLIRIINAQEAERLLLARRMHDGPAQALTNLILQAEICERLFDRDPVHAREELTNLKESVQQTFEKVRSFIFDLRPMMLDDLGLNPTIKRYVQDFEAKSGIVCQLSLTGKEQRLPNYIEITVFRALQALLSNVQRHSHATRVDITLNLDAQALTLRVEDDGVGFNLDEVMSAARQRKTLGLITLIEQIELLGGTITIDSAPGRGTHVRLYLPIVGTA
ncbi:MAG: histidine kinase [Ardenticatenia bacterium]|jgi:two-component system sensor histidine kinase DegS|nr:MAG: histidine kinase [Ardenticatenia bacterium]